MSLRTCCSNLLNANFSLFTLVMSQTFIYLDDISFTFLSRNAYVCYFDAYSRKNNFSILRQIFAPYIDNVNMSNENFLHQQGTFSACCFSQLSLHK